MIRFFFIFSLLYSVIYSQKLIIKDSETGLEIDNVLIKINEFSFDSIISFENYFYLFNEDDSVHFFQIGYYSKDFIFKDIKNIDVIYLVPKLFAGNEVIVKENRISLNKTEISKIINLDSLELNYYPDISDFIKKNTNLYLKDYGGQSGLKTFSNRGLPGENLEVLFNEFKINDIGTGTYDFSNLSLNSISRFIFSNNFDLNSGLISSGGIINLFTDSFSDRPKLIFELKTDNLFSKFLYLNFSSTFQKFAFNFDLDYSQSDNDYLYLFEGVFRNRNNSDFEKYNLNFICNYYSFFNYTFIFNYKNFKSGIPGFVVNNNYNSSSAGNKNNFFFLATRIEKNIYANWKLKISASYLNQKYYLSDPFKELLIVENNKTSQINTFNCKMNSELNFDRIKTSVGYEFTLNRFNENLSHEELMTRNQQDLFASVNATLLKNNLIFEEISVSGLLRTKYLNNENKMYNDYALGLYFSFSEIQNLFFQFNFINNNRITTFNEIYYSKMISMTELKPEKFQSMEINANYHNEQFFNFSANANLFNIQGEDKIVWVPSRLAFQTPINIAKINSVGFELSIGQKFFENLISYNVNYTYTNAKNKSSLSTNDLSFNKLLLYSPLHRFNFQLFINYQSISSSFNLSYASESFYTNDNSYLNRLKPYFISDLSFAYVFRLFDLEQKISMSFFNLFNENYMIIQSYPMPLMTINFNYELQIL